VTTTCDLHRRISDVIRTQNLFKSGDTLIIGLSGGADSTALLDLLATLPAMPLRLVAAHLNHCLRGTDADEDEQFCRDLAVRYGIPFVNRRVDVKSLASAECLNLEDAGRRARITFFNELLTTWQARAVVLAHHADDQAETILMRLLRGSGMAGLAGMPWRNQRGYVRPLLEISRKEIETYLTKRGLSWREDVSNLNLTFLRNSIRHELLPILERYNPAIRKTLTTTATILGEENLLLETMAEQAAGQICHYTEIDATCNITLLKAQPLAMQRHIIRLMLSKVAGTLDNFARKHLNDILSITISLRPNLQINLPHELVALKEYDRLTIMRPLETALHEWELTIPGPGSYQLPDGSLLRVALSTAPAGTVRTANSVFFDADRASFPWHLRTFRPGDRIQPLGMNGRKKVKDIFIDAKVPLAQRTRTALVFCRNELIWVVGLRMSHLARVDALSSHIVSAGF